MFGERGHCKTPCFSLGQRGRTLADQQDLRRIGTDGDKVSSVERTQWGTCSRNQQSGLTQSLQRRRHNSREFVCRGALLRARPDRRCLQAESQRRGAVSGCRAIWCSSGNGFPRLRDQSWVGTVPGVAAGLHKQGAEWHGHGWKLHWELFLHLRNCNVVQLSKRVKIRSTFHDSTLITPYCIIRPRNKKYVCFTTAQYEKSDLLSVSVTYSVYL